MMSADIYVAARNAITVTCAVAALLVYAQKLRELKMFGPAVLLATGISLNAMGDILHRTYYTGFRVLREMGWVEWADQVEYGVIVVALALMLKDAGYVLHVAGFSTQYARWMAGVLLAAYTASTALYVWFR